MGQSKALYAVGRVVCTPIFKLLYRYKAVNKDSLPKDGAFIIASNHLSNSDPVLLGLCQKRHLYFMAKSDLFKNKFFGALIRTLGAFPVERGAGDGKAIKTGEDLLNEGEVMAIFIEGGRTTTGDLMRPRSGCALIAQQTQLPVVPACITVIGNPKHIFAKRVIHYGKPLTAQELGLTVDGGRRELKDASNKIMGEIKKFREQDLREYRNS